MSHLSKPLAGAVAVLMVSVFAAYMLKEGPRQPETPEAEVILVRSGEGAYKGAGRSRHSRVSGRDQHNTSRSTHEVTSGVRTVSLQPVDPLPPLSGYVLDHFARWTAIPAEYRADGIVVAGGTVTLLTDGGSTASRTGTLVSPALSLKGPAMAAPVQSPSPMPEGAEVLLEISLSEDGSVWSPWAVADRHRPPDGRRVAPPVQASLSTDDIAARDDTSSTTVSPSTGPFLRYRLTLSASGEQAPSVADVRIWKREY